MSVVRWINVPWEGTQGLAFIQDARGLRPDSGEAADQVVDAAQRPIRWGFHDAHCHILPTGLDLQKLDLSGCTSHAEVLDRLRDESRRKPDGWLLAVHYDQNRYAEGHLKRAALDAIAPDRPILLRHSNGHASVANRAALMAAGVDASTPDPEGGTYDRDASGELTGLLLELAHERVTAAVPMPTQDEMVDAILRAGAAMASLGIVAATDMMTGRFDLEMELNAYRIAADKGCAIETRLFLQWRPALGPRGLLPDALDAHARALQDTGRSAIGGIKIFADGALGSRTAAIYGRYASNGEPARTGKTSEGREWSGQLIYAPARLTEMVRVAHDRGFSVATHAIGDYAVDSVLDAYEATGEPRRHRIEHAMLLDDDQIDRIARAGCAVVAQPEFLLRFGRTYRNQLGSRRASALKRLRSLRDAGVPVLLSSDRPIVPGDPRDGIRCAWTRPEDFDSAEALTPAESIAAYCDRLNVTASPLGDEVGLSAS